MWNVIYHTQEGEFHQISKHRKVSWKNDQIAEFFYLTSRFLDI